MCKVHGEKRRMACANGSFIKRIALQLLRSVLIEFGDFHAFNIEGTIRAVCPCPRPAIQTVRHEEAAWESDGQSNQCGR